MATVVYLLHIYIYNIQQTRKTQSNLRTSWPRTKRAASW